MKQAVLILLNFQIQMKSGGFTDVEKITEIIIYESWKVKKIAGMFLNNVDCV